MWFIIKSLKNNYLTRIKQPYNKMSSDRMYTRKEFAMLCHTTVAMVNTNVSRGKIIIFEGKIDPEDASNKVFFDKYVKKYEDKIKKENKKPDIPELYDKVVEKVEPKSTKKTSDYNKRKQKSREKSAESVDWDLRKKKAEALLKERNAEKALLSVKKMYGEMLPTDFVNRMTNTLVKSILSTFDNSLMNLAGVFCDELAGGDRTALSKVNQRLNEELQSVISDATEIAKKDIVNEIKEYSLTRGKGENK